MAATRLSSQGEAVWSPQASLDEKETDFIASFNQFLRSMLCGEAAPTSHPMFRELVPRRQSLRLANVYRLVHDKVRFVSLLKQQGAEYFGQSRSLGDFIDSNRHHTLVVLFFTLMTCRTREERENAALNREYFLRELAARDGTTLYLAVDLDVRDGRRTHICRYIGGVCVSHDELQRSLLKQVEGPRLACSMEGYLPISTQPRAGQLFPLMVSCPCRPSKKDRYVWQCTHCEEQIEVDPSGMLYCRCGMAAAESLRMKCNSPLHRGEMIGFWPGLLDSLLMDRRLQPKQLTILVLNASRVEQTKWMNDCLNRLVYPSLREVVQTEARVVTPDSNNLDPRALHFYNIVTLTLRVRCASPPDFPLTETEEASLFEKLSTLGELNSICVIMTPEEIDADCLKFLSKFSREAAKNVTFCIRDTSARLPSPGAATALKQTLTHFLNENNPPPFCYLDSSPLDYDCSNYPGFESAEEKWAKQTQMIESFFDTISRPKPLKCAYLREWRDARRIVDLLYPILQKALITEKRFLSLPPSTASDQEDSSSDERSNSTPRAEVRQRMRQLRECEADKLKEVQEVFNNFKNRCALIEDNLARRPHNDEAVTPENIAECVKLLVALPIHGDAMRRALCE